MKIRSILLSLLIMTITLTGFAQKSTPVKQTKPITTLKNSPINYKVTFIELGSVRCIPCKQMQTVMKNIERKYGSQVKVVFHDVWTEAGKPFSKQYNITAIPTQVFLDDTGKEYFRHEGYFPEEELVKVLYQKGVN
jgi:thioredoxin 1